MPGIHADVPAAATTARVGRSVHRGVLVSIAVVGLASAGAWSLAQDRAASRAVRPVVAFEYATFTLLDRGARLVTEKGVQTIDEPTLVDTSKIRESTDQGIFVRQTSLLHVYLNVIGRSGWELPPISREPQTGEEYLVRRQIATQ